MSNFLPSIPATRPLIYVTFHRHGMRAPIGNPFGEDSAASKWVTELPSSEFLDELSRKYPTVVHDNNPDAFDLQSFPFGCITAKGVDHLIATGRELKSTFPCFQNVSSLKVYSTNFQRTQVSVQSLLYGMDIAEGTEIEVRDYATCAMSFYHGRKELSRALSAKIRATDQFTKLEQHIATKVPILQEVFPSLEPESIDWITVADFLNCQRAHEHEIHVAIEPHADELVCSAVARFVAHYKDREFLAHFAGPLLLDVIQQTQAVLSDTSGRGFDVGPHLSVHSGHDVNLLGMLFALNAVLDDGHWPSYGASLTFEIVEKARETPREGGSTLCFDDLQVNLYYGNGVLGEAICPLQISLDSEVFNKQSPGATINAVDVSSVQQQTQSCERTQAALVTSLDFVDFIGLYEGLVDVLSDPASKVVAEENA